MTSKQMIEAWGLLVALSLATTVLTLIEASGHVRLVIGGAVLVLAGLKARIILSRYLHLAHSAFWMRSFDMAIGLFLLIAFALFAAAGEGEA